MPRDFKQVYQFKVALRGIQPPIWRRIQVPANYSFWDLHVAIQDAMGWSDCHLHAFRVGARSGGARQLIGIPDEEGFGDVEYLPGWEMPLAEHFSERGDAAGYEYDFGDGWDHEIVLEKVLPREPKVRYPRCTAGERACPPEDCGGAPGYETLLEILADPGHEQHQDMLDWLGGPYDPGSFDPEKVRFDDPAKRWRQAFDRP